MQYGDLEQVGDQWQLRFSRRLAHSPDTVWRAISEPEHLAAWFPQRVVGDWRVGAPLRFEHEGLEMPAFEGVVLAVEVGSVLEFRWDVNTIRLEVRPDGDGSILTLTDTFAEVGKAARDGAGWHVCLDSLTHHLDGTPAPPESQAVWEEINRGYVAKLGPAASTIGPPQEWLDAMAAQHRG